LAFSLVYPSLQRYQFAHNQINALELIEPLEIVAMLGLSGILIIPLSGG